jgi:hypothetical protein
VCALFPRAHQGPSAEQILRVSDAKLRGAGLSRAKLLALRDLAARARAGEIPTLAQVQRMDDAAIVEKLTQVRGIGRWTVEMLLIFRLGRPDVLPVDDYGIRKGFALTFRRRELPGKKEMERRGERWRPSRRRWISTSRRHVAPSTSRMWPLHTNESAVISEKVQRIGRPSRVPSCTMSSPWRRPSSSIRICDSGSHQMTRHDWLFGSKTRSVVPNQRMPGAAFLRSARAGVIQTSWTARPSRAQPKCTSMLVVGVPSTM